jgi:hypothetical protein
MRYYTKKLNKQLNFAKKLKTTYEKKFTELFKNLMENV